MENKLQKFIKENKVWLVIVLIFILLVAYKSMSSSIQADKEISVLQEKARLQELEKAPLNQCLETIDSNAEREISSHNSTILEMYTSEFQATCQKPTGHGSGFDSRIASGEINLADYCKPPTIDEQLADKQKILDKAKVDKEECYKRYK